MKQWLFTDIIVFDKIILTEYKKMYSEYEYFSTLGAIFFLHIKYWISAPLGPQYGTKPPLWQSKQSTSGPFRSRTPQPPQTLMTCHMASGSFIAVPHKGYSFWSFSSLDKLWQQILRSLSCRRWGRNRNKGKTGKYASVPFNSVCWKISGLISGVTPKLWQSKPFGERKDLCTPFSLSSQWSHLIAKNASNYPKCQTCLCLKSLRSHQVCLLISVVTSSSPSFPESRSG